MGIPVPGCSLMRAGRISVEVGMRGGGRWTAEFYRALPSGPFYGFNRPGVEPSEAIIENWRSVTR